MKITSKSPGSIANIVINGKVHNINISWEKSMLCEDGIGLICDGKTIFTFKENDKWTLGQVSGQTTFVM